MTGAEYMAKRRETAAAQNLCVQCLIRPRAEGSKSRCQSCLDGRAKYQADLRDKNPATRSQSYAYRAPANGNDRFNVCCAAHGFHRDGCKSA